MPESGHGTAIAGIIGAYTNFHECTTKDSSIAGVAGGLGGKNGEPGVSLYALKTDLTTEHIISSVRLSSTNSTTWIQLPGFMWHYGFACNILNCSFTGYDEKAEEAERQAYNYAYENKSLIVAGRGQYDIEAFPIELNMRSPWLLPSCEDARKVLSVGGSRSNKRKAQYSYWNNPTDGRIDFMDILAPGGDCANPNERLAFTTFGEFDYNCFSHTSASTAYASGVAALIHASSLSWQYLSRDGIEPEDYQGIIAASALDLKDDQTPPDYRYGDLYDDASGYGHLQANKIYEMLDDNYVLFHVSLQRWQDSSAFTFSNWTDMPPTLVSEDRDINNDKDLVKGLYTGKRREVFFEKDISMSDVWGSNPNFEWQIDDNHKAYIWTRGSVHRNKGRSGFNPYFQINNSLMNSGYGGMPRGFGMNIHDNVNNITSKTRVKIICSQWEFTDGPTNIFPYPITRPITEDMGVNFSVFVKVKPKTTSINAYIINDDYVVKTLMSENLISVKSLKNTSVSTLTLVNNLGIEVASINGVNISSLSIRNISSGVYFLNVTDNQNNIKSIPVRIVR